MAVALQLEASEACSIGCCCQLHRWPVAPTTGHHRQQLLTPTMDGFTGLELSAIWTAF